MTNRSVFSTPRAELAVGTFFWGRSMTTRIVLKALEWLLIVIFGLMVLLVFGNVVLRYGFNYGIIFSEEVSRFLFVWMVFLGSVLMLHDNGHLGVHTVTKLLPLAGKKVCNESPRL